MKPLPKRTYHQTLVGDHLAAQLKKSSHRSDAVLSQRLRQTGEHPALRDGDPETTPAAEDPSPRDSAGPAPGSH